MNVGFERENLDLEKNIQQRKIKTKYSERRSNVRYKVSFCNKTPGSDRCGFILQIFDDDLFSSGCYILQYSISTSDLPSILLLTYFISGNSLQQYRLHTFRPINDLYCVIYSSICLCNSKLWLINPLLQALCSSSIRIKSKHIYSKTLYNYMNT